MRILLVEDDPLLGDGLQRALRNDHYTVDWITSGAQVEGALQHDHFDLVLLDLVCQAWTEWKRCVACEPHPSRCRC
jgi:DNA-binding response OmpR family regulator